MLAKPAQPTTIRTAIRACLVYFLELFNLLCLPTLKSHVTSNPFLCHSYKKHGVGGVRLSFASLLFAPEHLNCRPSASFCYHAHRIQEPPMPNTLLSILLRAIVLASFAASALAAQTKPSSSPLRVGIAGL